jgi:hypothetical protein
MASVEITWLPAHLAASEEAKEDFPLPGSPISTISSVIHSPRKNNQLSLFIPMRTILATIG